MNLHVGPDDGLDERDVEKIRGVVCDPDQPAGFLPHRYVELSLRRLPHRHIDEGEIDSGYAEEGTPPRLVFVEGELDPVRPGVRLVVDDQLVWQLRVLQGLEMRVARAPG